MSNGKTCRDFSLLEDIAKHFDVNIRIIADKVSFKNSPNIIVITSGIEGRNAIAYDDMLKSMSECSVTIIPIVSARDRDSLCGLTSFLDAVQMGTPILMSDNTNIGIDIESLKMGYIYKAGDVENLKTKLEYMFSSEDKFKEMSKNCIEYGLSHNYDGYCQEIYHIIHEDYK